MRKLIGVVKNGKFVKGAELAKAMGPSPTIIQDYQPHQYYESPANLGKWITSRRERREDLKRSGCREIDPSEKKDFLRPRPFQFKGVNL